MTIYTKNDETFEYEIDNKVYSFSKDQEDVENEHQDEGLINYLIILGHTSNDQKRFYKKTYLTRQERDTGFKNLKEEQIDFLEWQEY